jgi:hypothetical protein
MSCITQSTSSFGVTLFFCPLYKIFMYVMEQNNFRFLLGYLKDIYTLNTNMCVTIFT